MLSGSGIGPVYLSACYGVGFSISFAYIVGAKIYLAVFYKVPDIIIFIEAYVIVIYDSVFQ